MANPVSHANGTQTATINTEHSLTTATVAGSFQLVVDLANMAAGDLVEIREKRILLSGGTKHIVRLFSYYDAPPPDEQVHTGHSLENLNTDASSLEWTLKQVAGTGRSFPWQVFKWS